MAAIEEDAAKEKKALEAEIARLHEAVSEKDEALASKQSELDGVMAEIESLREIASHPQPKDLSDTVRRLEADVEERETKISTLNKAITKLKAQIMQSAKDLAEAKIRQSNDNLSFQDQLESKTSELTSKIMQLEAKIKRMAAVIDSHKKEESELAVDLKRVSDELARKEKEMLEKSSENARLHKMGSVHDTGGTGGLIGASEAAQASYKWELEKKYIRRVESLKKKLSEKRDHLTLTQDTMEKAARINQLEAKVATLEELNEQLRRSGAAFGEVAEPQQQQADSRSGVPAGIVITLEERVRSLMVSML
nr:hypothetical protein HK105_005440 [Polyrhizophydium stewartii]